ncbi:MAG: aldehyde dehydrogenase family protein [Gammaproteobacteria bacterium]|nr:aldehyde dehydrogenase family protein [Gammaproteobacteria bacterium]
MNFKNRISNVTECSRYDVTSPWNFKVVGSVPQIDATAADQVMANAYNIFNNKNNWLKPAQRIEILEKTAQIMSSQIEELTNLAAAEGGKPYMDSKVEVIRAIDGVKNAIECIRGDGGKEIPMNLNAGSAGRLAFTQKEPIGVVMSVSAFNHPLNLIVHQVIPGIAAGCPVIVKPAEDTALSCFRLVEILYEAGLPEFYCQAVATDNLDTATKLITDQRVAFFSFIGSAKVGWMLRSKLAPGTRCALEHGGAAPVIMAEDADCDAMVPLLAKGGFYHAGQVCVSVQRIFAHHSIAEKVAQAISEVGAKYKVGDPLDKNTEVGPLIRPAELERIDSWVQQAIAEGATLLSGGKKLSESTYACTVLLNPSKESKVSQLEIFGPVICVYSYKDIDDAIHQANDVPYSFQASVATKHIDTAMHCYKNLNASAVMVNDFTAFRVDWMPFAGLKQSGLGVGGIPYTFEDMQIEKMMVLKSDAL